MLGVSDIPAATTTVIGRCTSDITVPSVLSLVRHTITVVVADGMSETLSTTVARPAENGV